MELDNTGTCGRSIRSEHVTPAYRQLAARFYDAAETKEQRHGRLISTAHLPTVR